jgi:RND family efflux transporter MFP subunit
MNYLKNKLGIWGLIGVIVLIVASVFAAVNFGNGKYESHIVSRGNFTEQVTVSGKVIPAQEIDLSFEVSGKISNVYFDIGDAIKAGDIIARLDTSEINNEIQESESSLQSQIAQLNSLTSETNTESQLDNEKEELLNVLKKSYITTDDIVRNKVDIFIENPTTRFPEFTNAMSDYFTRQEINELRFEVQRVLESWKEYNEQISADNISLNDSDYSIDQLRKVEELLNAISGGTIDFEPTINLSQAQIDAYISSISSARNTIAGLVVEINQTTQSLRNIQAEVPVVAANVENAKATVSKLNSRLSKYVLVAPFDGILTAREIEPGEVTEIGRNVVSIIGDANLEIETFIPEVRIAGVDVSDTGSATLDAFGRDQKFDVYIAHIDPRETEKDGITTYRTLIDFDTSFDQVRPGMTAEVEIRKEEILDVILIPRHLVKSDDEGDFVNLVVEGEVERHGVSVGKSDGKGSVIIESGLEEGDEVAIIN